MIDLTNDEMREAILRALNENAKHFRDAAKSKKAKRRAKPRPRSTAKPHRIQAPRRRAKA